MTEDIKRNLIESFGRAWERGEADAMAGVFTEGGKFVPDPFQRAVIGRSAIAAYWADVPKEQADIAFHLGEIFTAGPWFSAEFKCTFRRRRTGELMDVRGCVFCEMEQDKISEMRMYWLRGRKK